MEKFLQIRFFMVSLLYMGRKILYRVGGFILFGFLGLLVGGVILDMSVDRVGLAALFSYGIVTFGLIPLLFAIVGVYLGEKLAGRVNKATGREEGQNASSYGGATLFAGILQIIFGFQLSLVPLVILIIGIVAAALSFMKERGRRSQMAMAIIGVILMAFVVIRSIFIGFS